MTEKLTPEQVEKFPAYVTKWVEIGYSTEPTNFEKSVEAAKNCYKLVGLEEPNIFCGPFNTPIEGSLACSALKELSGKSFKTSEEVNNLVKEMVAKKLTESKNEIELGSFLFGCQEYWLSFYDYFQKEVGLECCKKLNGLNEMALVCGWWIPLKNACIFTHRPLVIHRDSQNRVSNLEGPAIQFRGDYRGCDVFMVRGIKVSKKVVDRDYTVADIEKESNLEVRRIMVELYGEEKFLLDSNATVVHSDDFGTLYSKPLVNDEPIMMVKVVNSTPEADGTFKDYFIRVDPAAYNGLKTAHDAVASTWRNQDGSLVFPNPADYNPDIQT